MTKIAQVLWVGVAQGGWKQGNIGRGVVSAPDLSSGGTGVGRCEKRAGAATKRRVGSGRTRMWAVSVSDQYRCRNISLSIRLPLTTPKHELRWHISGRSYM